MSERWKKMIQETMRGKNFKREAGGPQSTAFSVAKKSGKLMSKQNGLVVTFKKGSDSDKSRKLLHIVFAFQKTLLVESMDSITQTL